MIMLLCLEWLYVILIFGDIFILQLVGLSVLEEKDFYNGYRPYKQFWRLSQEEQSLEISSLEGLFQRSGQHYYRKVEPWWLNPSNHLIFQTTTATPTTTTNQPPISKRPTIQRTAKQSINDTDPCSIKTNIRLRGQLRITGGDVAEPNSFPWLAIILEGNKHVCGGSLIDQTHVLTAAHCVASLNRAKIASLRIILGAHNLNEWEFGRQEYGVKTAIRHKHYNRNLLYNDVGMITLSSPVTLTDKVRPICLYKGFDSLKGKIGTVAGWGTLYEGGTHVSVLREVSLEVWANEDCRIAFGRAAPGGVVDSYLCAGEHKKDACSGDSGGPLMMLDNLVWTQIGIVSWGIGCGRGHYPGVYSRISHFLPWIQNVLKKY